MYDALMFASFASLASLRALTAPLRLDGCNRVGRGTRVFGRPLVHNDGRIDVGHDVTIHANASPVRLTTTNAGTITIGDRVTIDPGTTIFSDCEVRIEDDVTIGPNVTICDRDERGATGEIVIESGVRIGANARITSACRVTRGTIIAPGRRFPDAPNAPHAQHVHNAGSVRTAESETNPETARSARQARVHVHAVVAADFTIDELAERLAEVDFDGLEVDAEIAPFDQVIPTLIALGTREPKVELAFVWTRPEAVSPAFRALLEGEHAAQDAIDADVDAFASAIVASAGAARFVFVASFVLAPWRRGLGMTELRSGPTTTLMRMNLRLGAALEKAPSVFLLDAQRWVASSRDEAVDPKLWHAGKIGFTSAVLAEAALDVRGALRGVLGLSKKLVVVDLDDTLWGGIVGDVGWESLHLGGHDARGEAFVQFQRQLVALTKRGIALAVVSKNEESTAIDAMRSHPEMVIRPETLASYRINWKDKARNIVEIVEELNLGLQSVVFIDDNPVERGRVSEALPEVYVPDWPRDPTHYGRALESLRCFDAPHVSKEDLERNAMYATERQRIALKTTATTLDEWLASLGLVVRFERVGKGNVSRAAQLLNKTNQMNLRTRRLSESELLDWANAATHEAWAVYVSDRFGDAGLTGLFGISREGDGASLEDYLLSCRVMGRRVEDTMLWAASRRARELGARTLVIHPLQTKKNKPCLDFFVGAGLDRRDEKWILDLAKGRDAPLLVKVEGLA